MSSVLDELGLDPEEFEWHDLALCDGIPVTGPEDDMFFNRYETDVEVSKATDQLCLHCPVMKQCFFEGSQGKFGVWGGVYWNGAGKPDKNKNAHKTPEQWDEIYGKVA